MINSRNAGVLLGLGVLGTLSAVPAQAQFVLSYFNFNGLTSGALVDVTTIASTAGTGSLTTNFNTQATGDPGVTSFGGTATNAEPGSPAGSALALQGLIGAASNNSKFLELRTNTLGNNVTGLNLSFATQRTSTGFNSNQLSYSTNGGATFTDFGSPYVPVASFTSPAGLQAFDLTSVTALNNKADVRFRITFTGSSASNGNNRIDNLKLTAATVPAPSSVAVMALGGLMPLISLVRRRRAAK